MGSPRFMLGHRRHVAAWFLATGLLFLSSILLSRSAAAVPGEVSDDGLRTELSPTHPRSTSPSVVRTGVHTVTWWCVDLNDLWHVDVPVLITQRIATPPVPSPIEDPCTNPFPVAVPKGSTFMPGGTAVWFTNNAYPPAVRAALEGMGYRFRSQRPAEDFLSKMVEVRVEILDEDENVAAEFKFDPQRYFKLVRTREFFGQRQPPTGSLVDPEEAGRLPLFGFPVIAGPVPLPGQYTARVYWTLSDQHNDGLGLDPFNFLPAGEYLYDRVTTLFIVLP